jgi:hypothetical protein
VQTGLVPPHAPDQPLKTVPPPAVAVRRTVLPEGNVRLQRRGHESFPSALVTVPSPLTVSVSDPFPGGGGFAGENVAATGFDSPTASLIVQAGFFPWHAPDHPSNDRAGVAVNQIALPAANLALHLGGQERRRGLLRTVPAPATARLTDPRPARSTFCRPPNSSDVTSSFAMRVTLRGTRKLAT